MQLRTSGDGEETTRKVNGKKVGEKPKARPRCDIGHKKKPLGFQKPMIQSTMESIQTIEVALGGRRYDFILIIARTMTTAEAMKGAFL